MKDASPAATTLRRPRRDSQRRTKAILDAAAKLFLKDGFSATSMDLVADKANVSKRTVYGHFHNKEQLYTAVVKRMCSEILPDSMTRPMKKGERIEERFQQIGVAFLSSIYSLEQIRLFWLVVAESRTYPSIGRLMYEGPIQSARAVLRLFLDDLARDGILDIDDTESAAIQYLAMLKMDTQMRLLLNCRSAPNAREIETTARTCAHLFLHGALKRR
jgi:TetR/AcrR family transcriptional repressor of mexJK operon